MSYLLDKKSQRKRNLQIALLVIFFITLLYFKNGIAHGLSYSSHKIFHPLFTLSRGVGESVGNLGGYFSFKKKLIEENSRLKFELEAGKGMVANYRVIFQENQYLKGVLDRKNDKTPLILASILMRPNMSPYDTLIVDIGQNRSLQKGGLVFAYGTIPIGKVAEVYSNTAKIILFSSSGEKTSVVVSNINSENNLEKNISLVALGRGGGNFEIILPRDFSLKEGNEVVLPGINSYLLGRVETIISDPRDPFTKALLVSPVNIQDLKFVEIENP